MSNFSKFAQLHQSQLLLPNVWDAASAALFQQKGAAALATTSAALAWSLGYADGGALPTTELLAAVGRIMRVARVPVSIDLEDGYSDEPSEVAALVLKLQALGVVGINLEDGAGTTAALVSKIEAIRAALAGRELFINARCDVYLRNLAANPVAETVLRAQQYAKAGADGIFIPGLTQIEEVSVIAQACSLPLNLMLLPGMPATNALYAAGARRFSLGPAPFQVAYGSALQCCAQFLQQAEPSFAHHITYEQMNALF